MSESVLRQGVFGVAAAAALLLIAWVLRAEARAQQVAPEKAPVRLEPGEFVWTPELAPAGPVVVLVSVAEQRLYAYRNGVRIAYSTVSTGKPGHETPTGVFTVLEKDADHVSNLFKGAKMPNMERLTWSGIALHAGNLPGYPASHGCVRMPAEFSKLLFELDAIGTTVVIANEHDGPREAAHPGLILSPDLPMQEAVGTFEWRPDRAREGPVGMLLSAADRKLYVYRNGTEIGRAEIAFRSEITTLPEGVFTVLGGFGDGRSPFAPDRPDHRWMGVPLGKTALADGETKSALLSLVRIPAEFGLHVYESMAPGTTIYVTNREVAPHTTSSSDFVVMATHSDPITG